MFNARHFLLIMVLVSFGMASPAFARPVLQAFDNPSTRVVDRAPLDKFARSLRTHEDMLLRSESERELWMRAMAGLRVHTGIAQVQAVNAFFNGVRYGADSRSDDWTAPAAFLGRGQGDCEDFAVAKYRALRDLGIAASDLAVIVYIDPGLRAAHAALLVNVGQKTYLLDNLRSSAVPAESVDFGRILYVVNESATRLFVSPPRTRTVASAGGGR